MGCGSSTGTTEDAHQKPKDTKNGDKITQEENTRDSRADSRVDSEIGRPIFSYFQNAALYANNHFRDQHGSKPLKLNQELCDIAEKLAARMAKSEQLDQSPSEDRLYNGGICGENLFWKPDNSMPLLGEEPVKAWYAEKESYDFSQGKFTDKAVHFTQLIWGNSQEFGIASATSENGVAAVAVYYPEGNIDGEFSTNVKQ